MPNMKPEDYQFIAFAIAMAFLYALGLGVFVVILILLLKDEVEAVLFLLGTGGIMAILIPATVNLFRIYLGYHDALTGEESHAT